MADMFSIYAKLAAALALFAAITVGYLAIEHRGIVKGRAEVQGQWNIAKAAQQIAEVQAIAQRNADNAKMKHEQEQNNDRIRTTHNTELAQVRADIAKSARLRIGTALCPRLASTTEATSASRSDGTDTGSGLVSPATQRDIDALELKVEESFAAGRAEQAFIRSYNLAP